MCGSSSYMCVRALVSRPGRGPRPGVGIAGQEEGAEPWGPTPASVRELTRKKA